METKDIKDNIKRKRGDNWIPEDKILLKDLIKERVDQIEDKNTDTNTNQRKKKVWMELQENFNNLCQGCPRSLLQLKSQWTTMKIQAKKEMSDYRREILKTGGGPKPVESTLLANELSVWLPNEFVVDTNEFDCDAIITEINTNVLNEVSQSNSANSEKVDLSSVPEDNVTVNNNGTMSGQEDNAAVNIVSSAEIKNEFTSVKKKKPKTNMHDEKIKSIADIETQCRKELHILQVENEKKRGLNLDLENELLRTKIMINKNKLADWGKMQAKENSLK
ncbi:uncharacterized protein LOC124419700 [Lucilia cuprina]|uniref:uncharacterized protein LOC124419700 n=1 Tax=Lucilia cuprina TaxID=7375 RepID=UPI001F062931|nr:uncharacterized protein LOC124419700 [Lucilia cuprina]